MKKVICEFCNREFYQDEFVRITPKKQRPKKYAHKSCLTEADIKFYKQRNNPYYKGWLNGT